MTPAPPASPHLSSLWTDAGLAAALFAVDPVGLGGVVVRAPAGPVRDRWLQGLRALLPPDAPVRRIPAHIDDDRLLGGLDLAASLACGRPVAQRGVLAESDGGVAVLSMAERMTDATAARLAGALDRGEVVVERDGLALRLPTRFGLVALDEGIEPQERPPEALLDRLAFRFDLGGLGFRDLDDDAFDQAALARARVALSEVAPAGDPIIEALCAAAALFGTPSIRAPLLALAAARAHAALNGRKLITEEDAAVGARLVLAPRALTMPAEAPPDGPAPDAAEPDADASSGPPPEADDADGVPGDDQGAAPTEMMVAAVQAALPEDLLARALAGNGAPGRVARAGGSGAAAKSARRGRPLGARSGALRAGDRLSLVETLRAAAPWQRLRRAASLADDGDERARVLVRRDDFRIRRFVQREEATTVFVVDASGSAAFERLAEAKGAVELLLAKAYVSRSRVALITFRDRQAELLLPPTRSLTRARRRLAGCPGGGGTPLAAGMDAALTLGLAERAKDRTPLLVFLTDGRANIGLDGSPGRAAAEQDAMAAARRVGAARLGAVFVDTSARTAPDGDRFARAMSAIYAPLPYVDAKSVLNLVDGSRAPAR